MHTLNYENCNTINISNISLFDVASAGLNCAIAIPEKCPNWPDEYVETYRTQEEAVKAVTNKATDLF